MEIKSTSDLTHEGTQNFLVYGPPGVGKTHMVRTCQKDGETLLISAESGEISLADVAIDFVEVATTEALREVYRHLAEGDHKYEWVVLDSISEMAELLLAELLDEYADGRQAYGELAKRVKGLMRLFRALDLNVYFSAKQTQVQADGRLLHTPSFPGKTLTQTSPVTHDFDHVFAMVAREDDGGDLKRALLTEPREGYTAKVRDPYDIVETWERPDLGALRRKIITGNTNAGEDQ